MMLIPGTYYIGDPCYIFNEKQWDSICSKDFSDPEFNKGGEMKLSEDQPYGMAYTCSTAHGDGEFPLHFSEKSDYHRFLKTVKSLGVDAGMIGIININLGDNEKVVDIINNDLGAIVKLLKPTTVMSNGGYGSMYVDHVCFVETDDELFQDEFEQGDY